MNRKIPEQKQRKMRSVENHIMKQFHVGHNKAHKAAWIIVMGVRE